MDDLHVLFRIDFNSEREFTGVFSSAAKAQAYADRFPDERFEFERITVDEP